MTSTTTDTKDATISQLQRENQRLRGLLQESVPPPAIQLTPQEFTRYGRQMIVPQFQLLQGQIRLKSAKVLVVGAGGLGCPALLYLVASGIGSIGIVDDDTVELSNLHRQILHCPESVGTLKCDSARKRLEVLNPECHITTFPTRLSPENAIGIVKQYDCILDCTDSPYSRYLINDALVLCGKTLVGALGVSTEGQIAVYNYENTGPCYRCFHPLPPPQDQVVLCSDGGVIGPVIGIVGTAMAVETLKVLTGFYTPELFQPFLGQYLAYPYQQMRTFKMRPRQANCIVCGTCPKITIDGIEKVNYQQYCSASTNDTITRRITAKEASKLLKTQQCNFIDVRPAHHFQIASIHGLMNVPLNDLKRNMAWAKEMDSQVTTILICRFGNDSQVAVKHLNDQGWNACDIIGGLRQWSLDVDKQVPIY